MRRTRKHNMSDAELRVWLMEQTVETPAPTGPKYAKLEGPCRLWTRPLNNQGYGNMYYHGKIWKAHKISLYLFKGELTDSNERLACHVCDRKSCVAPDHLYVGSYSENSLDAVDRLQMNRGSRNGMNNGVTEDMVVEIFIEGTTTGINATELAREYGTTWATVQQILSRKNWAWLTKALVRDCSAAGCTEPARKYGRCPGHQPSQKTKVYTKCEASWEGGECDRLVGHNRKHYCQGHYQQQLRGSDFKPLRLYRS